MKRALLEAICDALAAGNVELGLELVLNELEADTGAQAVRRKGQCPVCGLDGLFAGQLADHLRFVHGIVDDDRREAA